MRNAVDSASASVAVPPYQPISLPKPSPSLSVLPFPSIYTVLKTAARLIARLPRYSHISYNIKEYLHWLPISTRIEYKVLFIVLKAQMGWHLNISVTPSDFRPLQHPFVLYAPWTDGRFLSLGLGQPWPCLDLLPLLPLLFGIAFHLQLVLLSYHHFLKLVSFLGANRTKSASVCLLLL